MDKSESELKKRTCRSCGKSYDYPVKGDTSSRHHCAICVTLPENVRLINERLMSRIQTLERELKKLTASSFNG